MQSRMWAKISLDSDSAEIKEKIETYLKAKEELLSVLNRESMDIALKNDDTASGN